VCWRHGSCIGDMVVVVYVVSGTPTMNIVLSVLHISLCSFQLFRLDFEGCMGEEEEEAAARCCHYNTQRASAFSLSHFYFSFLSQAWSRMQCNQNIQVPRSLVISGLV
jgi:hypothetical protein